MTKTSVLGLLLVVGVAVGSSPDNWLRGPLESYVWAASQLSHGRFGPHVYDDELVADATARMTDGRVRDFLSPSPPSLAVILLPLAFVPAKWLAVAWLLVNAACVFATFWLIGSCMPWPRHRPWVAMTLAATVTLSAPVREDLARGQVYLIMMLAATVMTVAWTKRRAWIGGAALSVLIMMKLTAWPVIVAVVLTGSTGIGMWAVGLSGIVVIASLPWVGLDTWLHYVFSVLPAWLATSKASVPAYQTIPGFFSHMLRFDAQWNRTPVVDAPTLAVGLTIAAILSGLVMLGWQARHHQPVRVAASSLIMTVLFAPLAEQYHYLLLIPALAVVVDVATTRALGMSLALTGALILVLAPLPYENPAPAHGAWALLAYPRLYGALVMLALLLSGAVVAKRRLTSSTHLTHAT